MRCLRLAMIDGRRGALIECTALIIWSTGVLGDAKARMRGDERDGWGLLISCGGPSLRRVRSGERSGNGDLSWCCCCQSLGEPGVESSEGGERMDWGDKKRLPSSPRLIAVGDGSAAEGSDCTFRGRSGEPSGPRLGDGCGEGREEAAKRAGRGPWGERGESGDSIRRATPSLTARASAAKGREFYFGHALPPNCRRSPQLGPTEKRRTSSLFINITGSAFIWKAPVWPARRWLSSRVCRARRVLWARTCPNCSRGFRCASHDLPPTTLGQKKTVGTFSVPPFRVDTVLNSRRVCRDVACRGPPQP